MAEICARHQVIITLLVVIIYCNEENRSWREVSIPMKHTAKEYFVKKNLK